MFLKPTPLMRALALSITTLATAAGLGGPAVAQALFSPAITVNQDVITYFELEQREAFLRALRYPGDPVKVAREGLIADRLKRQATRVVDLVASEEAVRDAMTEFASRANLSLEDFIKGLEQAGIAEQTFRDFIAGDIAWRDLIAGKYLNNARPTEAEVDRALGTGGVSGGVSVLLSEIVMPVTEQNIGEVEALAEQISRIRSTEEFSAMAGRYSATETRMRGGRMDWIPLTNLPPALQPAVLELSPGEVTAPLQLPNAVALFQLRDIAEIGVGAPRYASIDYAAYYIAGGRTEPALAEAQRIRDNVDTCDDLYGIAYGQPPEVLERQSLPPGKIPRDISLELARLDEGEVSTALTRNNGQTLVFLMLCGRTSAQNEAASREEVANALTQQRLAAFASSLLEQLKAEAIIVEK